MVHALRRGLLAFAAMAAAETALFAQASLTLDTAVQDALAHNAGLRAVRAGVSEAEAHVDQARAGWFPRVSVAETWQRGDQPVFVFSSLLSARQFAAPNFAIHTTMMIVSSCAQPKCSDSSQSCTPGIDMPEP